MKDCLPSIREEIKKAGLRVSEPILRQMHDEMQTKLRSGMSVQDFAKEVTKMLDEEMVRRADSVRAAKIISLAKVESLGVGLEKNKAKGLSAFEFLRAVLEGGSLKSGDGVNISARSVEQSIQAKLTKMYNQLDKLRDEIESGVADKDIIQEKAALQGEGEVGSTKNSAAKEAARIFHAIQKESFELKRSRNPMMRFMDDYYFEQTHSREKLSEVGKDEWIQSVLTTHGQKSFPDLEPKEKAKALGEIYDAVTAGSYGSMNSGGNILFSMARGRTLIPNDWKAFADYHARFGEGTVSEVMHSSIRKASRDVARLEKFGPEWRSYLDRAYQKIYESAPEVDKAELAAKKGKLEASFKTAIGDADAPAAGLQAKLVQGAMAFENMALNSAAVISSIPDFALQLGLLQDITGKTQIEIAGDLIKNAVASATNRAEARAVASRLGIYAEAHNAALMRDLGTDVPVKGFSGKAGAVANWAIDKHSKITLMNRYLEAQRSAIGVTLSNYLSEMVDTPFSKLPQQASQGLQRYGISADAWAALKYAKNDVDFRGRMVSLLDMESVDKIPADAVELYLRKSNQWNGGGAPSKEVLDFGRSQLGIKLGVLINEHADLGTSTAGTRQRAFLNKGMSINDGWGQVARLLTQFKSAGVVSVDLLRRRYYSGMDPKGSWGGVASTGMTLLFFGALAQYAKDALGGKTPEDPRNPEFILKTLVRSGAAGPWGDVFIGEVHRNGVDQIMQAGLTALAGPVIGKAIEATAIGIQTGREGAKEASTGIPAKYPAKRALRFGLSQAPAQNLFWAQGALNYYFFNAMRESLEPGFVGQLKRKVDNTPGLFSDKQRYFVGEPE